MGVAALTIIAEKSSVLHCTQHHFECEHHDGRLLQVCHVGNSKYMSRAAGAGVIFQNDAVKFYIRHSAIFSVYVVVAFLGGG